MNPLDKNTRLPNSRMLSALRVGCHVAKSLSGLVGEYPETSFSRRAIRSSSRTDASSSCALPGPDTAHSPTTARTTLSPSCHSSPCDSTAGIAQCAPSRLDRIRDASEPDSRASVSTSKRQQNPAGNPHAIGHVGRLPPVADARGALARSRSGVESGVTRAVAQRYREGIGVSVAVTPGLQPEPELAMVRQQAACRSLLRRRCWCPIPGLAAAGMSCPIGRCLSATRVSREFSDRSHLENHLPGREYIGLYRTIGKC